MVFSKKLISWYLQNKRAMPWRETKDPYHIWLSEIILQQTRVAQGLPYYIAFTEAFPSVFDLAKASEQEVLKLWQGLGYYSRARNLHFTAKYIVDELHGKFPESYKELLKLKGVGDYTASAIASICYNEVVPVVDGNVYRVLSRYFNIHTPINSTQGIKEFKELAIQVMDQDHPADYNQAIMEFGALQCKPKSPYCIVCPLQDSCEALHIGTVQDLPVKIKKTKIRNRFFNYFIFKDYKNQYVLKQRTAKDIWQGLYEFPLIEKQDEVITEEILMKDKFFRKFLGSSTPVIDSVKINSKSHKLSHQHIFSRFYEIQASERLKVPKDYELVHQNDLEDFPVPVLIQDYIKKHL